MPKARAIVKALTACGYKDIYESELTDDDLIADPRYGIGCLLLTFFKRCGDQMRENWPVIERALRARAMLPKNVNQYQENQVIC